MAMNDIFFDKKISLGTRKQLYMQIPMNVALCGCDSWALNATHTAKLATLHHKCARCLLMYRDGTADSKGSQ
jgi:hypothetical protein